MMSHRVNVDINIEHIDLAASVYEIAAGKPRAPVIRGLTKKEAMDIKSGETGVIMRKTKKPDTT